MDKLETTEIIDNFDLWKTQVNTVGDKFHRAAPEAHLSVLREVFGDSTHFMTKPVVMVNGTAVAAHSFSIDAQISLQDFKSVLEDLQKKEFYFV